MPRQKMPVKCINASPNMITNMIMLSATVAIRVLSAPFNTLYHIIAQNQQRSLQIQSGTKNCRMCNWVQLSHLTL